MKEIGIDGQVRLVHLVRLQMDNFCLFLHQQTDKHTNDNLNSAWWANGKRMKEIIWAFFFCFLFATATYEYFFNEKVDQKGSL